MPRELWYSMSMAGERKDKAGEPQASEKPILETDEQRLRFLDALHHEAAIDASQDPSPPTPDELDDEAALAAFVDRLVKTPPRRGR